MTLNRQFTKVYDRPRKPLADQPFGRALQHFAELVDAVDEVVVQDVRFALTGEQSTEAPADSGSS